MTTRLMIGYSLLVLLVAGCAFAVWWMIHNSESKVRRRKRRARRASRELKEGQSVESASDQTNPLG